MEKTVGIAGNWRKFEQNWSNFRFGRCFAVTTPKLAQVRLGWDCTNVGTFAGQLQNVRKWGIVAGSRPHTIGCPLYKHKGQGPSEERSTSFTGMDTPDSSSGLKCFPGLWKLAERGCKVLALKGQRKAGGQPKDGKYSAVSLWHSLQPWNGHFLFACRKGNMRQLHGGSWGNQAVK